MTEANIKAVENPCECGWSPKADVTETLQLLLSFHYINFDLMALTTQATETCLNVEPVTQRLFCWAREEEKAPVVHSRCAPMSSPGHIFGYAKTTRILWCCHT